MTSNPYLFLAFSPKIVRLLQRANWDKPFLWEPGWNQYPKSTWMTMVIFSTQLRLEPKKCTGQARPLGGVRWSHHTESRPRRQDSAGNRKREGESSKKRENEKTNPTTVHSIWGQVPALHLVPGTQPPLWKHVAPKRAIYAHLRHFLATNLTGACCVDCQLGNSNSFQEETSLGCLRGTL